MSNPNCIFCKIASRDAPAEIPYESDSVVAFRDLSPQAPTHIVIIPKEHMASAADVDDGHGQMLADVTQAATQLARTEGIDESGWRLVTNVGPDAGQTIFHLHFHLLGGAPMGRLVHPS
jgi:histidine triad (HIT) family protein